VATLARLGAGAFVVWLVAVCPMAGQAALMAAARRMAESLLIVFIRFVTVLIKCFGSIVSRAKILDAAIDSKPPAKRQELFLGDFGRHKSALDQG
jgi:hypothetical protein